MDYDTVPLPDMPAALIRAGGERRAQDRRQQTVRTFFCQFSKSRRRGERRRDFRHMGGYVDVHPAQHLMIILGTLLLCIADVYLTLLLLNNGGKELNPVMDRLIQYDLMVFYVAKYTLTAAGLIWLLVHRNFRLLNRVPGECVLYSIFTVYLALVGYEIHLLSVASDMPGFSWSPWAPI